MTLPTYPLQPPTGVQHEPALWAPWYGISFRNAIRRVFKKYATFSGRAGRGEYWWWVLADVIVGVVLSSLISVGMTTAVGSYRGHSYEITAPGPLSIIGYILAIIWGLAVIVPTMAVSIRRLHDVNMSGWMILLGLIPFVGGIVVLIFTLLGPSPEGRRFDQIPLSAYEG